MTARSRPVDHLFLVGTFSLALFYSLRRLGDSDLWGHLKCGEYLFTTGKILDTHYYNCSWPDFPYLNHEWLFQAIIYPVYYVSGEAGLVALQVLLVLASFFVVYRIMREYTDNLLIISFILSLGIIASSHRFALRPQHFSYLFLVCFLYSLHQYQRGIKKYAYGMPLLMVLWVNIHAESLWGILVPGVFLAVEYLKSYKGAGLGRKDLRTLSIIFGLVIGASLINPFGYKTVIWPLLVMKEQFAGVEELLSPVILRYLFFWVYCAVFVSALFVRGRRLDPSWVVLSLIFCGIAWTANRGIPHFVFVSAPLVAAQYELFFQQRRDQLSRYGPAPALVRLALGGFLLYIAVSVVMSPLYLRKFDNIPYPEDAVKFIKEHDLRGNVLNEHYWGGYLIWNAYPRLKPYIDGRFFHRKFYDEFRAVMSVSPGWQDILARYNITMVLLPYSATEGGTLRDRLFSSLHWRLVYWDDVSLLYLKDAAEQAGTIEQFGQNIVNPDRQLFSYAESSPDLLKTAKAAVSRNLASAPRSYKALITAANVDFAEGDYRMALKRYQDAAALMQGKNAWLLYRSAVCCRFLGDLGSAEQYIVQCLAIVPESAEAQQLFKEISMLKRAR